LVAKNAFFKPAQDGRPAGYLLVDVKEPKKIASLPSLVSPATGQRVVITPQDAPDWLKPNECFLVSNVTFEQLSDSKNWKQYASTFQLIRSLRNPSLDCGADMSVAIHSRILHPFLDITLLFLGMPLVLSKSNRNVFVAIGLCIVVVSVFVLVTLALQSLGANHHLISPALAAWAPLILFVPIAVGMAGTMWE
jgi:lipopolysaccharide export system permease protein